MRICAVALAAAWIAAQPSPQDKIKQIEIVAEAGEQAVIAGPDTVKFMASEFTWESKPVKGAPYSAEAVTETTQVLADGNRIARKNTSLVYRDGEGRTRREQTIDAVGPWTAGQPHQTIMIHDPVAGVNYILDPSTRTARKISFPKLAGGIGMGMGMAVRGTMVAGAPPAGGNVVFERFIHKGEPAGQQQSTNTSLGSQSIDGVMAEGTRSVITIPAGQIGNERPIEIVSERWVSSELQEVVLSKRSDPRFGETVYKLANVRRGEPGRHLFELPPDYTLKEEGKGTIELKLKDE